MSKRPGKSPPTYFRESLMGQGDTGNLLQICCTREAAGEWAHEPLGDGGGGVAAT